MIDLTSGNLVVSASTVANSTTTGALVVKGGVGIAGNAYIGNPYTAAVPTVVNRAGTGLSSLTQYFKLVVVTASGPSLPSTEVSFTSTSGGFTVNWTAVTGATAYRIWMTATSGQYGLGQAVYWQVSAPTTTLAIATGTGDSTGPGPINTADTSGLGTVNSTSITTGALVVSGGIGVTGNLYVGGNLVYSNLIITGTTVSTSTATGALTVAGGLGVVGNLYAGGNVILGSSTNSNLVANATTTSTSSTTGALVVKGGAGFAGNINIGGTTGLTGIKETVYTGGATTGTITPDATNGSIQTITLTGSITLNAFANPISGQSLSLIITQPAAGGPYTLTSSMLFAGGIKTLSTAASAVDMLSVSYISGTYYASLVKGFA